MRTGRTYSDGIAEGSVLLLSAPLSFYGGVDVVSGDIIDHSHPDRGKCITSKILVMPGGKGSSSSSSVLAELIRLRTGPVAIILERADPIMTVGCLVAQSLYQIDCPLIVASISEFLDNQRVRIIAEVGADARIYTEDEVNGH